MHAELEPALVPKITPGSQVSPSGPGAWHLEIPPEPQGRYHLAQLDDYAQRSRRAFPWRPPVTLNLRARVSAEDIPGTWGFGFWNDPFGLSLGFGGSTHRLPALPEAAWFFFASPPNYLSLQDDLPSQGFLMATFQSLPLPAAVLGLGLPALPLLFWSPTASLLRPLGRRFVRQSAAALIISVTEWHTYTLQWEPTRVVFHLDGEVVYSAPVSPRAPLGLVLWIDNQYAAFPPRGRLAYGTIPNPQPAWLEIAGLEINSCL